MFKFRNKKHFQVLPCAGFVYFGRKNGCWNKGMLETTKELSILSLDEKSARPGKFNAPIDDFLRKRKKAIFR